MPLYRLLISVLALWVFLRHAVRREWQPLRERFGRVSPPDKAPHLWLHAASNGELASVRPVLQALHARIPDLALLVTCNTPSGVELARSWGDPRVSAQLAPLDLRRVTERVCARWHVAGHVSMEAELWPNRFRGIEGPVLLLGARMSEKTARGWGWLPGVARNMLARVSFAQPQDAFSGPRLIALGLPCDRLGPVADLKAFYNPPNVRPDAALAAAFPREATWLAASTRPGEEETVIEAHLQARRASPGLRLILAPRHPRRAAEIRAMIEARGLTCAQRSRLEAPDGADVYLADTLGEMPLWYRLAGRVFVAGTLSDRGGHTPYEPAAFGAALLHGPDVRNFSAAYARLEAAEAARCVPDADGLAQALVDMQAPSRMARFASAAQDALRTDTDLEALVAEIATRLPDRLRGDRQS